MGTREFRFALAAALLLITTAIRAAEPAPGTVLHLRNGGFVPGALLDSDGPAVLRWQGTPFASPFDFETNAVDSVTAPAPPKPPRAAGDFRVELAGGDVVYGALVELSEIEAVIDSPRAGRLQVRRDHVRRLDRWLDNAGVIYLGPNGLADWHERPGVDASANAWREESGAIVTEVDGAAILGSVGLPARAVVEFEISWKTSPDFVLALGVDDDETTARRAYRFEVWDGELVVVRESDQRADLASLGTVLARENHSVAGRVRFRSYLDQEQGRLVVFSARGERLADLNAADPGSKVLGEILLENRRGDVRLDRLRVTRWDGSLPTGPTDHSADVERTDGTAVPGKIVRYDPASKGYVVRGDKDESRVAADRVARLTLSTAVDERPRTVSVALLDGTRLSGDLVKVQKGELWLSVPGLKDAARLPASELRSLVLTESKPWSPDGPKEVLTGRLELEGVRLQGRLGVGRERPDASCLVWQPVGSTTSSPLRPGTSGRIVYKEPKPKPLTARQIQTQQAQQMPAGMVVIRQQVVQPRPAGGGAQGFLKGLAGGEASPGRRSLYLMTGDVIPSEVTKIDENGVTFRSTMAETTFVPHHKVKAVDLAAATSATVRLNKPKRERLLTLPRVQKGSPPTHLIRSRNGDYLRGRVVAMDGKTLQVEVRLETRDVPRDRVSRIIWLHADEAGPTKAPAENPPGATLVQAVRGDGVRLTFRADEVKDSTVSGTSDVLGACRVRLDDAEQILIGAAIEQEAARLAYRQWKLQNAPEPKYVQDDGNGGSAGRAPGTESAMVGKPAPDFELDLLAKGEKFRLSASKGTIVVLDFWATWCGPCLQAMPQVEKVAAEFRDQGVRLVAVNLQESPDAINAMLQRHKLDLTVALDRDGLVAEKYGANAIPQTVVIDRDGNVSRLFIGGGPHLGDQLRDALKALPAGGDTKKPEG